MTCRTITMCQIGVCRQAGEWEVWLDDGQGTHDSILTCGEHLVDCMPRTGHAIVRAYRGGKEQSGNRIHCRNTVVQLMSDSLRYLYMDAHLEEEEKEEQEHGYSTSDTSGPGIDTMGS